MMSLHFQAGLDPSHKRMGKSSLELLLEAGADPTIGSLTTVSPFHWAAYEAIQVG